MFEFDKERYAHVKLGDTDYPLLLNTRATKEICDKYDSIARFGDMVMSAENMGAALDTVCWCLALLINQPIEIHNRFHKENSEPLVSAELLELLSTPADFAVYQEAIMDAFQRGMKRNIPSGEAESDEKN